MMFQSKLINTIVVTRYGRKCEKQRLTNVDNFEIDF